MNQYAVPGKIRNQQKQKRKISIQFSLMHCQEKALIKFDLETQEKN